MNSVTFPKAGGTITNMSQEQTRDARQRSYHHIPTKSAPESAPCYATANPTNPYCSHPQYSQPTHDQLYNGAGQLPPYPSYGYPFPNPQPSALQNACAAQDEHTGDYGGLNPNLAPMIYAGYSHQYQPQVTQHRQHESSWQSSPQEKNPEQLIMSATKQRSGWQPPKGNNELSQPSQITEYDTDQDEEARQQEKEDYADQFFEQHFATSKASRQSEGARKASATRAKRRENKKREKNQSL